MTQQKHLKQLVRERMKQTGQPYAAARRSVLLADPRQPKSPHRPGSVPGSTALRVLLAHAGRELSEPMVFGLAGGVGIGVFSFLYEKEDFASFFVASRHCWHDHTTYLSRACKRFGLTTVVKESTSPKLAEKQLREMPRCARAVRRLGRSRRPAASRHGAVADDDGISHRHGVFGDRGHGVDR